MGQDTQSKGKWAELRVIGELVREGFTAIYTPVIDVEGVDIIVKREDGSYSEIQVKSRSRMEDSFQVRGLKQKENLFLVLHVLNTDDFWIIPSADFIDLARKTGNSYVLSSSTENRKKMQKYRNDWDLLRYSDDAEAQAIKCTSKRGRIRSSHHKESDFYPVIIEILKTSGRPLTRLEIVKQVKDRLYSEFSDADKEILKNGRERWENTLRWAISNLARRRQIRSNGKNQWTLPSQ